MALSRREFLHASAAGGTALGSLVGLGVNLGSVTTRAQALRIKAAQATPSVCPYCAVGCATIVHTRDGEIVNIEGDPHSPHNEGTLCPKGAAIYQLHKNPHRAVKVLHRRPGATAWEEVELEWAMDRVAELIQKTRDETFVARLPDGTPVNHTTAILSLGGATLDNEWNHLHQKLMRGLGVVAIENQARLCHSASVPGLASRLGLGAATVYPRNLEHADCIVIQGSNMAECHPVAFRWALKARAERGARIIHVDPRFTRTSALADIYAPIRAGTDIAFLGGLINYVLNSVRWNTEPFFREYVTAYTNAAIVVHRDFRDAEDLDGVFSGLMDYTGNPTNWPFDGFLGQYDPATWQYVRRGVSPRVPRSAPRPAFDDLIRSLRQRPVLRDDTLQHPRCVLNIVKRHFSRYTPEMVEQVTGCPRDTFLRLAQTILRSSARDRTTAWCYAVGWTQHTDGPQVIGCAALLQLLLGNIGRPGGGILGLRGHASLQGSTDLPTVYHSIHGYLPAPSALRRHRTLRQYLASEARATGYWVNTPKFMVSYLKSMYGDAATPANDFGYDWHPKISGDHSHLAMIVAMAEGRVKGMLCVGQNPATSLNARLVRKAMRRLEWLVVKDNFVTETASFWHRAPELQDRDVRPEDIPTEVFFFPSAQVAELEGSFTNTQRLVQWHHRAALPPGDCRSDVWFTHQLALRLRRRYAASQRPRDQGFKRLTWDFEPEQPGAVPGEPAVEKILKEINGYQTRNPRRHLSSAAELRDDGSTTCASWIYCGVFPAPERNLAKRREPDPQNVVGAQLTWGWAWPANRRVLYNRASADPRGRPWSDRKRWVWWDGRRWTGFDAPDFPPTKPPSARGDGNGIGLDAHSGAQPFIMLPEGVGRLFAPDGLVDGPLPTHYEPAESPIQNPLYVRQSSPVLKHWAHADNTLVEVGDERYPHVGTTYRLAEHHTAGGMSRWSPWLTQLMPELFIEISPELAAEKQIRNADLVRVVTPRGAIAGRAVVTRRLRPLLIGGRVIHHVGVPLHWGWQGVVTGDAANELTPLVADPNASMHEGKAFCCNLEKA